MDILPQIAQRTQMNAAELHYFAEKDSLSLCGLVGTSQISVRLIGLHCADCLSTLECYSPADPADYAEEYSKLHYFAEKDRLGK